MPLGIFGHVVHRAAQTLERLARANANKRAYLFAAHTAETIGDRSAAAAWRQRAASLR